MIATHIVDWHPQLTQGLSRQGIGCRVRIGYHITCMNDKIWRDWQSVDHINQSLRTRQGDMPMPPITGSRSQMRIADVYKIQCFYRGPLNRKRKTSEV
jgi:hypothetical protein